MFALTDTGIIYICLFSILNRITFVTDFHELNFQKFLIRPAALDSQQVAAKLSARFLIYSTTYSIVCDLIKKITRLHLTNIVLSMWYYLHRDPKQDHNLHPHLNFVIEFYYLLGVICFDVGTEMLTIQEHVYYTHCALFLGLITTPVRA